MSCNRFSDLAPTAVTPRRTGHATTHERLRAPHRHARHHVGPAGRRSACRGGPPSARRGGGRGAGVQHVLRGVGPATGLDQRAGDRSGRRAALVGRHRVERDRAAGRRHRPGGPGDRHPRERRERAERGRVEPGRRQRGQQVARVRVDRVGQLRARRAGCRAPVLADRRQRLPRARPAGLDLPGITRTARPGPTSTPSPARTWASGSRRRRTSSRTTPPTGGTGWT